MALQKKTAMIAGRKTGTSRERARLSGRRMREIEKTTDEVIARGSHLARSCRGRLSSLSFQRARPTWGNSVAVGGENLNRGHRET